MTTLTDTQTDTLESLARALRPGGSEQSPAWLTERRAAALSRFNELGLPASRDEDWRQTNLDPLRKASFTFPAPAPARDAADPTAIGRIDGLDAFRLVFINGRFAPALSNLEGLDSKVTVLNLAEGLEQAESLVGEHFDRHVGHEDDVFALLNTAMMEDGLYIHVPDGAVLSRPLHVIYHTEAAEQPVLTNPRNLIIVGRNAQATVIEHFVSSAPAGPVHLTNAVTEIIADEDAILEHYRLEEESADAFHISSVGITQQARADVSSHTVLFGGRLVRNNVRPMLEGDHCGCLVNGLYVPAGRQHVDNHMRVEHVGTHGDSRQFYKGVLLDEASSAFSGRIVVAQQGQKTDAKQTNANLLLSDKARAHTKPQLEIYADDVKCTHGATCGQLDDKAIFYLQSRGIDRTTATAIMVFAFAAEALERMRLEPIRERLGTALLERLPGGDRVRSVL